MKNNHSNTKYLPGIIIFLIGLVWLLKKTGVDMPEWLISWQMLLIGIGLFIGFYTKFNSSSFLYPLLIGLFFLLDEFWLYELKIIKFIWPLLILFFGLWLIYREIIKKKTNNEFSVQHDSEINDTIKLEIVMSGVKRSIVSEDFKGGEVNCVLGGADLNMKHIKINGTAVLIINCILGGAKLILPDNITVTTKVNTILGGVEDKRFIKTEPTDSKLIIKGSSILGEIELSS